MSKDVKKNFFNLKKKIGSKGTVFTKKPSYIPNPQTIASKFFTM